jgi:hypothetical protein
MITIIPVIAAVSCESTQKKPWIWGEDPSLWLYRGRTISLLKKYSRLSVEVGRLPSLLGREFFRTHVTSYHMSTFEDVVIFVHDVERSLEKLDSFEQKVIAKIVLMEYTQDETARLTGYSQRHIRRSYIEGIDHLSEIFLRGGLLNHHENDVAAEEREIGDENVTENSCQGGEIDHFRLSDWE